MLQHVRSHGGSLALADVGRVAHDEIQALRLEIRALGIENVDLLERHKNTGTFGVLAGYVQGFGRDVPRRHLRLWQLCRQRHGDAAATRADVEDFQR